MKAIHGLTVGVACMGFSVVAMANTNANTRSCVDEFVAQELDGRSVDVRIMRSASYPMPLILLSEMPMQLTAVERSTGRTIATATCEKRRGLVEVKSVPTAQ